MESWLSKLEEGDSQTAWDLFVGRYRNLLLATIRRLVPDRDDIMDVFAMVCQELSANDFSRLRRYSTHRSEGATPATWLVAVVRNLTVDWLRQRDGRHRPPLLTGLSPLQQRIHALICAGGHSAVDAFELLRSQFPAEATFRAFLREVRETFRMVPCPGSRRAVMIPLELLSIEPVSAFADPAEREDLAARIREVLALEPEEIRLAIDLTVVERLPAAEVARLLGWPNAKAVYNRVSRALLAARAALADRGITRPEDLQ